MNSRAVRAPTSRVGAACSGRGPSWGRPGALGSGLSSAGPPSAPPRRLPSSLQTHAHPAPLSSGSSLLDQTRSPRCILLRPSRRQSWSSRRPIGPGALYSSSLSHHLLLVHSPPHPTPDSLPADLQGRSSLPRSFRADLSLHLEMTRSLAVLPGPEQGDGQWGN